MATEELFEYARFGEEEHFFALLGTDLSLLTSKDDNCNTVMHYLAANNHMSMLARMLDSGLLAKNSPLLNAKNSSGNTPLHWAALNGQTDMCRLLIELGATLSEVNEHDETPIDICVRSNAQQTLDYFMSLTSSDTPKSS